MIVVAGTVEVPPEHHAAFADAALRVTGATRSEPGCISYAFWADVTEPGRFLVFEEWETEPDVDAHMSAAHFLEFRAFMSDVGATRNINRYTVAGVRPNNPPGQ